MRLLTPIVFALLLCGSAFGQTTEQNLIDAKRVTDSLCCAQAKEHKHRTGYKPPTAEVLAARSAAMKARHDSRMALLPKQTDATFDIVAKGWTSPVDDQGNCGSCWLVSAKVNVESAYIKAGYGATWRFSNQYLMDCGPNSDPCNGGDEYDIFSVAKSDGLVTDADYGVPYQQQKGRCQYTNQKKWKIGDFLYVDPVQQSGRSSVQSIKNGMVAYGMVSIALDASLFDNYTGGVMTTGQNIDHAVNIVGWDDSKSVMQEKKTPMDLPKLASTGAFRIQNQWSDGWGLQGFCWVSYNSYLVEGMVCSVSAPPPPPPTPPTPPIPPTPPTPINTPIVVTLNPDGTWTITGLPSGNITLSPEQIQALKVLQSIPLNSKGVIQSPKVAPAPLPEMIKPQASPKPSEETWSPAELQQAVKKFVEAHNALANPKEPEKVDASLAKKTEAAKPDVVPASTAVPKPSPTTAVLLVRLPKSAENEPVTIDGHATSTKGVSRSYVTYIPDSATYVYDLSVRIGSATSRRTVVVRRGQVTTVDFTMVP